MTNIFPITALQKNSAEVRKAAQGDIVHVTENGRSSYVFASEPVFEDYVAQQRAEAAREALLFAAIDAGEEDLSAGRTHTASSVDDLFGQLDSPSHGRTVA